MGIDPNSYAGRLVEEAIRDGRAKVVGSALPSPPEPAPPKARPKPVELVAAAFKPPGTWVIPLRLPPVTNGPAIKKSLIGRAGRERRVVGWALSRHMDALVPFAARVGWNRKRVRCTIDRLGGGKMDSDNLQATGKWVRDTVALFLGVDDDSPLIEWKYAQKPYGKYGVILTLEPVT